QAVLGDVLDLEELDARAVRQHGEDVAQLGAELVRPDAAGLDAVRRHRAHQPGRGQKHPLPQAGAAVAALGRRALLLAARDDQHRERGSNGGPHPPRRKRSSTAPPAPAATPAASHTAGWTPARTAVPEPADGLATVLDPAPALFLAPLFDPASALAPALASA